MDVRPALEPTERPGSGLEGPKSRSSARRTAWRPPRTRAQTGGRRWQTRRRWRRIDSMIAHVILFKPRPDLTPAERDAILDGLSEAAREIPAIRRFRVGRRVRHGLPGYEQAMREDFEYSVIVEV